MLLSLPKEIFAHILDALDTQYTPGTGENGHMYSHMWQPGGVSTLRNITLASRALCAFTRPRLFAHIDFDAARDVQGRAARLLRYFAVEEDSDSRVEEIKQLRLQSVRSFRFRDGRASLKRRTRQPRWEPDLATPLGRLLALLLDAPYLQVFAFEGNIWTLAGEGELLGYQGYIHAMSSKPSLRVLALTNAYDIPVDVFFRVQNRQQFATGLQTLFISKVTFYGGERAQDAEIGGETTSTTPHLIERLTLGRLNYTHFFELLRMRYNSIESLHHISSLTTATPFRRLKSLSLALSAVPTQMAALWNFVYGLRETLEDLQLRGYESIPGNLVRLEIPDKPLTGNNATDKYRARSLPQPNTSLLALRPTFHKLHTLIISTHILGSPEQWINPAENFRWGLPLSVDLLETFVDCSTPKIRQLNLQLFFMGEDVLKLTAKSRRNILADKATANPVWQKLDSLLTSIVHANPTVTTSITLLPFFAIQRENLADAEALGGKRWQGATAGDAFGLDQCLPTLFAKTTVDVHVDPVNSDRDMITYLWNA